MAIAIRSGVMTESPGDPCAWPVFESVKDNVRGAQRAIGAARHATEPLAADAVLKVRRHPLQAVGIAIVAGAVAGSFVGFGLGWFARTRARNPSSAGDFFARGIYSAGRDRLSGEIARLR